jgi:predicted outer membrane repeat protein
LRSSGGADVTIIDATGIADPGGGRPVVRCDSGEGPDTVLDGFTLTGGTGATSFEGIPSGGGMFIRDSSPTVVNCKFVENSAVRGGGMRTLFSSATVTNCDFIGNIADSSTDPSSGAGMHNQDSDNLEITGCTFSENTTPLGHGGGMYSLRCDDMVVSDCAFIGNEARIGGGMHDFICSDQLISGCSFTGNSSLFGGAGLSSSSTNQTVTGCTFTTNSCTNSQGGGMSSFGTNTTVSDSVFNGNDARLGGGGIYYSGDGQTVTGCTFRENEAISSSGGGMLIITGDDLVISDCAFIGNVADSRGGGIASSGSLTVSRCTFFGNTAGGGGGMSNGSGSPTVTDSVFSGNVASEGGAMANSFSSPDVRNCTFSKNIADFGGGFHNYESAFPIVTNCIFWMNSDLGGTDLSAQIHDDLSGGPASATVNYSDVQGGAGLAGTGNISTDPQFMDADGPDNQVGTEDDDLRLQTGSPCIDSGDPAYVASPGETDLDGHDRVLCDRVEMGAFEFAGDFACDQTIDLDDFANWGGCMTGPGGGPYAPECATFDCDADSDIDMKDFAEFGIIFSP